MVGGIGRAAHSRIDTQAGGTAKAVLVQHCRGLLSTKWLSVRNLSPKASHGPLSCAFDKSQATPVERNPHPPPSVVGTEYPFPASMPLSAAIAIFSIVVWILWRWRMRRRPAYSMAALGPQPYRPPGIAKIPSWLQRRLDKEKLLQERAPPTFWASARQPRPLEESGENPEEWDRAPAASIPFNEELAQWLTRVLGSEGANEVLAAHPSLMLLPPVQLEGRLKVLMRLLGRDAAFAAIRRQPRILDLGRAALRRGVAMLTELLGAEVGRSLAAKDPLLLGTRWAVLVACKGELESLLGRYEAAAVIADQPALLRDDATNLRAVYGALAAALGEREAARRAVARWPFLLATAPPNVAQSFQTVGELVGPERDRAVREWPPLLVAPPDSMRAVYAALEAAIGGPSAALAVSQVPSILSRTAGDIAGAMAAIERFVAPSQAAEVLRRTPALANADGGRIVDTLGALADVLGPGAGSSAVEQWPAFLEVPTPTLRASVATLAALLGSDLAVQAVVSLGNCLSPDQLHAAHAALVRELGKEVATAAVRRDPGVLGLDPAAVRAAVEALAAPLGHARAVRLLGARPELLRLPAALLEGNAAALRTVVGAEGAAGLGRRTPAVLRRPLTKTVEALVQGLGAEGAARAVRCRPELLGGPTAAVWRAVDAVAYATGPEAGVRAVEGAVPLLDVEVDRSALAAAVEALAPALGRTGALRALGAEPALLRTAPATLVATVGALTEGLGAAEAAAVVRRRPRVLEAAAPMVRRMVRAFQSFPALGGPSVLSAHPVLLLQAAPDPSGTLGALTTALGPAATLKALQADPSVLAIPPAAVEEAMAALTSTLGRAGSADAVAGAPILLRRWRTADAALATLTQALGQRATLSAVEGRPGLLSLPAPRLRAALDALTAALGVVAATEAVVAAPILLEGPLTEGVLAALVGALGVDRTLTLLRRPETLRLGTRPVDAPGALASLTEALGDAAAIEAVMGHPALLWAAPGPLLAAARALLHAPGRRGALCLVAVDPAVLAQPPAAVAEVLRLLTTLLGPARALRALTSCRGLSVVRPEALRATLQALTEEVGNPEAVVAAVLRHPAILLVPAAAVGGVGASLEWATGSAEAARAMLAKEPRLLTVPPPVLRQRALSQRDAHPGGGERPEGPPLEPSRLLDSGPDAPL